MSELAMPFIRIRVTVVVRSRNGRICFVRHCKEGKRYWLLPGGGQEPFEPLEEAARRELFEELRIKVSTFKFIAMRETMNKIDGRHIQFPIFEAVDPDFSTLALGEDQRIEGIDFFKPDEIKEHIIFPNMYEDLIALAHGKIISPFRTLEWVP